MKTSTMLLLGAAGYIAYTLWKKQQAGSGTATAAVTGPGPDGPGTDDVTVVDEIDYVPVGWGPSWVSIMPGGGRRGGGGGHHHHHGGGGGGGGGHRGRH